MSAKRRFQRVTSMIVPLERNDVDTDLIIPAQCLTTVSSEGFADTLFKNLRASDPSFPLNDPRFQGAQILVAGENFGCGSSREHAVWAIRDYGFRVVIAKSFADIFSSNAANNGLLLVRLPAESVDGLFEAARTQNCTVTVDLAEQYVELPDGGRLAFAYDPFRKHCLLEGLDILDYILACESEYKQYLASRAQDPLPRVQ